MNPNVGSEHLPGAVSAPPPLSAGFGAMEAAELQDHLLTTFNDLERLQRLLDGMCDTLLVHFSRVHARIDEMCGPDASRASTEVAGQIAAMREELSGAITGLQFQDMGTQLISHTLRRLRNCADRLAQSALADDEDGAALIEEAPTRPNPVTQDEMDAGSVELF
mgnify:FL=1